MNGKQIRVSAAHRENGEIGGGVSLRCILQTQSCTVQNLQIQSQAVMHRGGGEGGNSQTAVSSKQWWW